VRFFSLHIFLSRKGFEDVALNPPATCCSGDLGERSSGPFDSKRKILSGRNRL
jgi:hypothetical protein